MAAARFANVELLGLTQLHLNNVTLAEVYEAVRHNQQVDGFRLGADEAVSWVGEAGTRQGLNKLANLGRVSSTEHARLTGGVNKDAQSYIRTRAGHIIALNAGEYVVDLSDKSSLTVRADRRIVMGKVRAGSSPYVT